VQRFDLGYDNADQLLTAPLKNASTNALIKQYTYGYDLASNRTSELVATTTTTSTPNSVNEITSQSGGVNRTLVYDLNGSITSDGGTRTFEWDGANRMVAINYTGFTTRSEFTYDGLNRVAKIVEKTGATINSTRKFVWCGQEKCESRDATDAVTQRNYSQGQYVGTTAYFYTRDHLGSIREMFTGGGTVVARYDYDPYGRSTTVLGTTPTDFNFTGLYRHSKSNLDLATYRAYDPDLGRWLSRDPIAERGGINLYGYVKNDAINAVDILGLAAIYTDETTGRTYFNPNPELPGPIMSWESRNSVKPDSLPNAAGPYDSANVYPVRGPYKDDPNAYGPNDILMTDDARGRWLHGGGSDLDDPLAPLQGWEPTHGCTRFQNNDIQDLVDRVRDFRRQHPGVRIPYSRTAPPVGDFPNLFSGGGVG
jgi:RHS repeat-associated protein